MKILARIGLTSLVVILMTTGSFASSTPTLLNEATLSTKAIEYSEAIVQLNDGIKALQEGYVSAAEGANQAAQLVFDYENYKTMYASGKGSLPANQMAFATYKAMFGDSPSLSNEDIYNKFGKSAVMADEALYVQLQSTQLDLKSTKLTLESSSKQLVQSHAKLSAAIDIQNQVLTLNKRQLDEVTARYQLGLAASVEVDKQKTAYEKAKLSLEKSKRSLENLERQIKSFGGIDIQEAVTISASTQLKSDKDLYTLDAYVRFALENRKEIQKAKLELNMKQLADDTAKKYLFNELLLERQSTANDLELAKANLKDVEFKVKKEVIQKYQQLQLLKEAVNLSQQKLSNSQEQLTMTQSLLSLGKVTKTQVLGAELDVLNQKMALQNAIFDYNQMVDQLTYQTGVGLQSGGM